MLWQYSIVTAEGLWAWNRVQSFLFEIFLSFFHENEGESAYPVAHAIWHMFQSDKNQREMVLAVAKEVLPAKSRRLKNIQWLLKKVEDIAPFRNAAVHTPIIFQKTGKGRALAVDHTARPQIKRRMEATNHRKFWRAVSGDLMVLAQYAAYLSHSEKELNHPNGVIVLVPSPHRPKLLSLRQIAKIGKEMSLPPGKSKRTRQRRASHP